MRYRTKLFLTCILTVAISTFIALAIIYQGTHRLVFNQIRSQLLSIATTRAATIDGNMLEQWQNPEVINTPEYNKFLAQLRMGRNLHRRSDVYIGYMYVIRKNTTNKYVFIADAEEDPKNASHFGDSIIIEEESLDKLGKFPFVTSKAYKDPWGTWLTAYAPIYNKQKTLVGILGVDIGIDYIHTELHHLIFYGFLALFGAIGVSILIAYILSRIVTASLKTIYVGVEAIRQGDLNSRIYLNTKDEFNDLAIAINEMAKNIKEKERLTVAFGRYVSHHVLDTILHSNVETRLEGERKKVTILFCDIHEFTLISENLPPEVVVSLLNQYLEKMISIIFSYHGTLDKFTRDGIMAEFGVPLEDPLQELNAIRTAIDMQKMVASLSEHWKHEYPFDIKLGIGIHTGLAVVGNIGSNVRMEYTAIGDTVNVASRLEKATKDLSVPIIISEDTYKNLQAASEFRCQDLGLITLYGREQPIRAYAILTINSTPDEPS